MRIVVDDFHYRLYRLVVAALMLTLKKAAASNVIPFGLLYMRLLQWWLRAKGFSQRGNPLHMIKDHAAMLVYLRHVEETVVPVTRPNAEDLLSSCNTNYGCLPQWAGEQS